MSNIVEFDDLPTSDLHVGSVYRGGSRNNVGDDPLAKLLPVGNQGGFRYKGSPVKDTVRFAAVYTNGEEEEWPDHLDKDTGVLTYFGDNRRAGQALLNTRRKGNVLLKNVFAAKSTSVGRLRIPPFALFEKAGTGRDVVFRGLLAPGVAGTSADVGLTKVWRDCDGGQFENYQASFTVLNTEVVTRRWIAAVVDGVMPLKAPDCPSAWRTWVESGQYDILPADRYGVSGSR